MITPIDGRSCFPICEITDQHKSEQMKDHVDEVAEARAKLKEIKAKIAVQFRDCREGVKEIFCSTCGASRELWNWMDIQLWNETVQKFKQDHQVPH